MAITIQGVRVTQVSIVVDAQGSMAVTGNYELLSSTGIVLAKQGFNGYSDLKVSLTPTDQAAMEQFVTGIKNSVNKALGLE